MVEFEKLYNEIFAMISLKYFWRGYSDGYVKGESPDWYSERASVGIEVTQAIMQEDGEAQSVVNQYLGKLRTDIPEGVLLRYSGRTYFYNERLWAIMPETGKETAVSTCKKALYRFAKKLERLNTNYRSYDINGIYMYLHDVVDDEDVARFVRMANDMQKNSKRQYDIAFLNCVSSLKVVELASGRWETVHIPADALAYMRSKAEKMRHGAEWENGMVFSEMEAAWE